MQRAALRVERVTHVVDQRSERGAEHSQPPSGKFVCDRDDGRVDELVAHCHE